MNSRLDPKNYKSRQQFCDQTSVELLGMLKSEEPAGPSFSWLHVRSNTVRISWPRVTGQAPHSGRQWLALAGKWLIPLTTFHSPADHLE